MNIQTLMMLAAGGWLLWRQREKIKAAAAQGARAVAETLEPPTPPGGGMFEMAPDNYMGWDAAANRPTFEPAAGQATYTGATLSDFMDANP